jgi:hypothetical protein
MRSVKRLDLTGEESDLLYGQAGTKAPSRPSKSLPANNALRIASSVASTT